MEIHFERYTEQHAAIVAEMLKSDSKNRHLFSRLLNDMPEQCRVVFSDDRPAGILLSEQGGSTMYLWVYISPEMRGKGVGSAVLRRAESEVPAGTEKISSFFNRDDEAALSFTKKYGYIRKFDSDYMEYTGGAFPDRELPVRPYADKDYPEAQKMYAEAFHRMRVQVGDFPDSVVYPPSEKNRQFWKKDAENYFLYEENGEIVGVGHLNGAEIGSVSVRIDKQGKGIGSRFVPYLINRILERGHEKVCLECVVGNPARKLYDRLGFNALYTERFVEKKVEGSK